LLCEWETGQWYLAVTCRNCNSQFAFMREDQPDRSLYLTDGAEMVLTCPECYFPLAYNGSEVVRVQAQ
jgi:RNase P subunit RPR2